MMTRAMRVPRMMVLLSATALPLPAGATTTLQRTVKDTGNAAQQGAAKRTSSSTIKKATSKSTTGTSTLPPLEKLKIQDPHYNIDYGVNDVQTKLLERKKAHAAGDLKTSEQ